MVYKRYIKKNGKLIGPYYYESYRDENGDVKKRYLGNSLPSSHKSKLMVVLQFSLIIVAVLALFGLVYTSLTGHSVSDSFSNDSPSSVDDNIYVVEQPQESPTITDETSSENAGLGVGEQIVIQEQVQDINFNETAIAEENNSQIIDVVDNISTGNDSVIGFNETQSNETLPIGVENLTINNNITIEENLTIEDNVTVIVKTTRARIRLGEPVKWTKNVSLSAPETAIIEIPKEATDIKVEKIDEGEISEINPTITGNVALEIDLGSKLSFWSWVSGLFGKATRAITGRVILEDLPLETQDD